MSNVTKSKRSQTNPHQSLIYRNTDSLYNDLRNITEIPELCDIKFLVGKNSVPIYGVKSILATRNWLLYSLILAQEKADVLEKKALKRQQSVCHKMKHVLRRLTNSDKGEKTKEYPRHLQIVLKSFEPKIFKKVMDHIMSGRVKVDVSCVIGVMEAAIQFGIEDLRDVCYVFARKHITKRWVLPLFASIDNRGFSRWTKYIKHEILKFITKNAEDVLQSKNFRLMPRRSALQILSLPDLQSSEETKRAAANNWQRQHQGEQLLHSQYKSTISSLSMDFQVSITELIDQAELLHAVSMTMSDQSFIPPTNTTGQEVDFQTSRRQMSETSCKNNSAISSSIFLQKQRADKSLDRAFLYASRVSFVCSECAH